MSDKPAKLYRISSVSLRGRVAHSPACTDTGTLQNEIVLIRSEGGRLVAFGLGTDDVAFDFSAHITERGQYSLTTGPAWDPALAPLFPITATQTK